MTIGEKLLNLTAEYQASKDARSAEWANLPGTPAGREPHEIAADYEAAIKELLSR